MWTKWTKTEVSQRLNVRVELPLGQNVGELKVKVPF